MNNAVALHPVGQNQVNQLVSFMEEFYAIDQYPFNRTQTLSLVQELMVKKDWGKIWMIEHEGADIGYLVISFGFSFEYGGRDAFVDELYIVEGHRRKGIGKTVLQLAEKWALEMGIKALHLEVENHNEQAHRLYLNRGFKNNDRTLMSKRIAP